MQRVRDQLQWAAATALGGPVSGLDQALLMDRTVDLLVEKAKSGELWPELYLRALEVLETLPLSTSEFDRAAQRLTNALRYARQREHGAATFELRMLRSQLAV